MVTFRFIAASAIFLITHNNFPLLLCGGWWSRNERKIEMFPKSPVSGFSLPIAGLLSEKASLHATGE
jgi:hypothetical protein